ncbi:hypothetical protein OB955_06820 [Halobacteria archaeon AArc-m2/3/4]|uniref:DUF8119 domain-containing protein n=1 Tax=Natronoglomus mannanivorans TaxID=2979990 RepID=A0ABT2QBZ6_9EURY|nr:hypothetical protein [Halobacteria archaeon AArc-m2/3/4]
MTRAETDGTGGTKNWGRLRTAFSLWRRVITDLVVVGLWVVVLTLLFLSTGWPRWLYYTLLLVGVVSYTQFTRK